MKRLLLIYGLPMAAASLTWLPASAADGRANSAASRTSEGEAPRQQTAPNDGGSESPLSELEHLQFNPQPEPPPMPPEVEFDTEGFNPQPEPPPGPTAGHQATGR